MNQADAENRAAGIPEELGPGHFTGHLGEDFQVTSAGGVHALRLNTVEELPGSPRVAGGFRLEFSGPAAPTLPQATYAFLIDNEPREIFMVPRGPNAGGEMQYEAVFY